MRMQLQLFEVKCSNKEILNPHHRFGYLSGFVLSDEHEMDEMPMWQA